MAHFAQLDGDNVVERVIVVHNNELKDDDGNESEEKGIQFLKNLFGQETRWVQTSYNSNFRKWYAGIGWIYNEELDVFHPPQPFPSWTFNEETAEWEPPVPIPENGKPYCWDEQSLSWILIEQDAP